ncbi:MAG: acyltransferase [Candidatus Paceibacterota bacterium]|jgi:peptidoglycan/LPS O-acetylase OafA/YrhL
MQIDVSYPLLNTILFGIVCLLFIIATMRMRAKDELFSRENSDEMKGYAMLAIIFSHIGYFLSKDTQFLFPFSIGAGVAVNVFFFLSGYGLAMSAFKKYLKPVPFYIRRFFKIIIPLWITLLLLYVSDFLVFKKTYTTSSIVHSFLGWFPNANIWNDVNSPLWYITILFFFYLIFPIIFRPWHPYSSASLILICGGVFAYFAPIGVRGLYETHWLLFPLGVLFASFSHIRMLVLPKRTKSQWIFGIVALVASLAVLYGYAGIGTKYEQYISIVMLALFITAFWFIPFRSEIVEKIGKYSFGMYLIHWPLMYRYGVWFQFFPPWFSTLIGIVLSFLFAVVLDMIVRIILKLRKGE